MCAEKGLEVISVVGLGYVGLPLAVEFAANRPVIGYDHDLIQKPRPITGDLVHEGCAFHPRVERERG